MQRDRRHEAAKVGLRLRIADRRGQRGGYRHPKAASRYRDHACWVPTRNVTASKVNRRLNERKSFRMTAVNNV